MCTMRGFRLSRLFRLLPWILQKAKIANNLELGPNPRNGLSKRSVADCLQTRPIYRRHRLFGIRGKLAPSNMHEVDQPLKMVFGLN